MAHERSYPQELLPITKRLRAAVQKTVDEEMLRAQKEGIAEGILLDGVMNALLNTTVRFACRITFPKEDRHSKEMEERVYRMQAALSDALTTFMRREVEPSDKGEPPVWPGKQEGRA